ncbi:MAG: hypothetical protein Q7O04_00350 [Candidatus Omnitrophota bacterium]|nr:hypothetical protein [Candidatus Omnitrophota bacterium]
MKKLSFQINALKETIQKLINIIQRIIVNVSLFVVYYLVFGLTVAIAFLFNRKIARGRKFSQYSTWLDATGYDNDINDNKAQS